MNRERLCMQMDHNIHKVQALFHRCEKTNFLCFNLLQGGSSNLYQVFTHTNVAVFISELTADVCKASRNMYKSHAQKVLI